jgi:hypothetical protein
MSAANHARWNDPSGFKKPTQSAWQRRCSFSRQAAAWALSSTLPPNRELLGSGCIEAGCGTRDSAPNMEDARSEPDQWPHPPSSAIRKLRSLSAAPNLPVSRPALIRAALITRPSSASIHPVHAYPFACVVTLRSGCLSRTCLFSIPKAMEPSAVSWGCTTTRHPQMRDHFHRVLSNCRIRRGIHRRSDGVFHADASNGNRRNRLPERTGVTPSSRGSSAASAWQRAASVSAGLNS